MQQLTASIVCVLMFSNLAYAALFFPASSVIQMTASVSVPVEEYLPERRIILDWCYQMNYDLPYNVSSFYNIPIWPGKHKYKSRRDLAPHTAPANGSRIDAISEKYVHHAAAKRRHHRNDFTAGELYQGIEDTLVSYGIHATCLLRSVCDLARHPFADTHQNVLTEVLTFILTPSLHQAFDESEQLYRDVYEAAEQRGFLGEDCQHLFHECKHDILGSITAVMFSEG